MPNDAYSPAVRDAAHKLYQFVLAHELELVQVSTADIEALLAVLGVAERDIYNIYRLAITEAHARLACTLGDADQLHAFSLEVAVLEVYDKICIAQLALMDRITARDEEWLDRMSR